LQDAAESARTASGTDSEKDARFAYAKVGIYSTDRQTAQQALEELVALNGMGYKPSESAFWAAVGHMETGAFAAARSQLASLVRTDPANERAAALLEIYKSRVRSDGKRGLLLIGGAVLLVAGALAFWFYRGRSSGSGSGSGSGAAASAAAPGAHLQAAPWRAAGGSSGSSSSSSGSSSRGGSGGSGGSSSEWRSRYSR
jgi:hypothetical protein